MDMKFIDNAAGKAFNKVDRLFPKDDEVKLYESLSPEAFDTLAKTYGADDVIKYIKEMEYKRLGGKNG